MLSLGKLSELVTDVVGDDLPSEDRGLDKLLPPPEEL